MATIHVGVVELEGTSIHRGEGITILIEVATECRHRISNASQCNVGLSTETSGDY